MFTVGGQPQIGGFKNCDLSQAFANPFFSPRAAPHPAGLGTAAHLCLVRAKDTRAIKLGWEQNRGAPPHLQPQPLLLDGGSDVVWSNVTLIKAGSLQIWPDVSNNKALNWSLVSFILKFHVDFGHLKHFVLNILTICNISLKKNSILVPYMYIYANYSSLCSLCNETIIIMLLVTSKVLYLVSLDISTSRYSPSLLLILHSEKRWKAEEWHPERTVTGRRTAVSFLWLLM